MSEKKWFIIDAKDKVVGRLATKEATILIGKNKADFTQVMIMEFCYVINSDSVIFTGKNDHKFYYRNTGYPGGLEVKRHEI